MTFLEDFPPRELLLKGETLRLEALAHGVARLTLDRPRVRNAFNAAMAAEITRALEALASREAASVRVLLLEGEGPVFCAGADLDDMRRQAAASPGENRAGAQALGRLFATLAAFPAPVLCWARGAALGGGLGLACCADLVLAEPSTLFATPEVRLGLLPAVIAPFLIRRLGLARATPLILTGRRIQGTQALDLGLAHQLLAPDQAPEAALTGLLRECLSAAPLAARAAKRLLLELRPLPGPEVLARLAETLAAARASGEGQLGLESFFARSAPPWALPAFEEGGRA